VSSPSLPLEHCTYYGMRDYSPFLPRKTTDPPPPPIVFLNWRSLFMTPFPLLVYLLSENISKPQNTESNRLVSPPPVQFFRRPITFLFFFARVSRRSPRLCGVLLLCFEPILPSPPLLFNFCTPTFPLNSTFCSILDDHSRLRY